MLSKKPLSAILGSTLICTSFSCSNTEAINNDESKDSEPIIKSESTDLNKISNSTTQAIESMVEKGFCFEKKPEEYSSLKEVKLDIFQKNNLDSALKESFKFILNDKPGSFIDDKSLINGAILKNTILCENIMAAQKHIDSAPQSQEKDVETVKRLSVIKAIMKADKSIQEDNVFLNFISSMRDAYAAKISRKVASDILKDKRNKVETVMSTQNSSKEAELSSKIPTPSGLSIGISAGIKNNESSSEKAFYKIDNSGNIKVSIGTGFKNFLSLDTNYNLEFTYSLIFYSLEQFLDTYTKEGKISSIEFRANEIENLIGTREEMRKKEKLVLSQIKTSIEWFLKASEIIPQGLNIDLPNVTFASCADTQKTFSTKCDISASAACLASAGASVSSEQQIIDTSMKHSYLNLIENDCSASSYVENSDEIISFLKQENVKKFKEVKEYAESYFKQIVANKTVKAADIMSILTSNILGDLRRYNTALSVLANENSSSEQKKSYKNYKKKIEKRWLGSFGTGRVKMLKAAITCAAYLRDFAHTEEEINLFKQLYFEIEHLSKLQLFAKNSSGKNIYFQTGQNTRVNSTSGQFSVTLPAFGTSYINVSYSDSVGDAYFDTSEDIAVQIQIPMFGDNFLGDYSIRNQIKKIMTKLSEKHNYESEMFSKTLEIIDKNFDDVLKQLGVKTLISVPGVFSTQKYMNLNYFLTKIDKSADNNDDLSLPEQQKIIKKSEDEWKLKLIKRIDSTVSGLKLGIFDYATPNISHSIGKASSIIGSDTLSFITSRYNVFQTGMKDKENSSNYLWNNFKNSQSEQFKNLFINISDINKNVRYELQCIWNQAIKNIKSDNSLIDSEKSQMISNCEKSFSEFLNDCDNLSKKDSEENFKKASNSFDKVMELNYNHNFMNEIKRIHKIK